jgi:hypothetical protein
MPLHRHRPLIAASLLAATVTLAASPAWAAGFPDVPADHWAQPAVTSLSGERPLLEPLADGLFHGEAPFTRLQFARTMNRLITEMEDTAKTAIASPATGTFRFADIPASHPDRAMLLRLADQYRLYEGVAHLDRDYFGANEVVSRFEMAVVVDNLMRQAEAKDAVRVQAPDRPTAFPFTDVPPTVWARPIVESVWGRYGVMVGFPDRTFRGSEELTRYQFAAVAAQTVPLIRALVTRTAQEKHLLPEPAAPAVLPEAPWRTDVLLGVVPTTSLAVGVSGRQDIGDWFVSERLRLVPLGLSGGTGGELGVSGGYGWDLPSGWRLHTSLGVGIWGLVSGWVTGSLLTAGYGLEATWRFAPAWDLLLGVEGRHGLWSPAGANGVWLPGGEARVGYWPTEHVVLTFGLGAWGLPSSTTGVVSPAIGPQVGVAARF